MSRVLAEVVRRVDDDPRRVHPPDLVPPGVGADHRLRVAGADGPDEGGDAPDLLGDGDRFAELGGVAKVQDVRPRGDGLVQLAQDSVIGSGQGVEGGNAPKRRGAA